MIAFLPKFSTYIVMIHYTLSLYAASDPPIHFGRAPVNMCPHEVQCRQCSEPFEAAVIEALEDTTFSVSIGSSGADRGYEAITGENLYMRYSYS